MESKSVDMGTASKILGILCLIAGLVSWFSEGDSNGAAILMIIGYGNLTVSGLDDIKKRL